MDDRAGRGISLDKCSHWEIECPNWKSFFFIWNDSHHRERKEVLSVVSLAEYLVTRCLISLELRGSVVTPVCSLVSIRLMPAASPHYDLTCSVVPRNRPRRVGLGCPCGALNNYSPTTSHWCVQLRSWVLCLSLCLCFVPLVINCEVLLCKPASCSVPDVFNSLSGPQTALPLKDTEALLTWSGSLTPLLKGDSIRSTHPCWCLCCLQKQLAVFQLVLTHQHFGVHCLDFLHSFSVYFDIVFDLHTVVWSTITMSWCAVIYSPINIFPSGLAVGSGRALIMLKLKKLNSCQNGAH